MIRYLSANDNKSFGESFLDGILDWVENELAPDGVFTDGKLKEWSRDSYDPLEIYSEDELREALGIEEATDAT